MGHLIPAGTGFPNHKGVELEIEEPEIEEEEEDVTADSEETAESA